MSDLEPIAIVTAQEQKEKNTGRFERRPSTRYQRVVDAIEALAQAEGWDMAERAIAEALDYPYILEYQEKHGVRQGEAIGSGGLNRLTGTRDMTFGGVSFPGSDHTDVWLKDGKVARVSEQPYGPITDTRLREMLAFCEKHALRMRISARSFHFAGHTLLIDIVREDEQLMP